MADTVQSYPSGGGPHPLRRFIDRLGRHYAGTSWTWVVVFSAGFVLVAVGWPVTVELYGVHPALAMAITMAYSAAAVLAIRWAWAGLALAGCAAAGMIAATAGGESLWPWPVTGMLAHCLLIAVLALRHSWWWAVSGWSLGVVLTALSPLLGGEMLEEGGVANGVVLVSLSGAIGLLGAMVRLWGLSSSRVEQAESLSVEEARRRRELEERNRIARELHDVVAHSMSVISVQATTARYRNPGIDAAAQREFEEIAGSSREALGEMRMLLSVLRGEDDAPTAPEPGLEEIDALVENTRASGTAIRYEVLEDGVPQANPATGLAAYRTVQEALSNALRHAPGAAVDVVLFLEAPHWLSISVVNEAPPSVPRQPAPGAGLGLSGIRERVAAVGGTAEMGPTPGGGFAVRASLPL